MRRFQKGSGLPLAYRVNDAKQLVIDTSSVKANERPCEHAYAFKLAGFKVSLNASAIAPPPQAPASEGRASKAPVLSDDLTLEAAEAALAGPQIRLEQKVPGQRNVGHWSNADARVVWTVRI